MTNCHFVANTHFSFSLTKHHLLMKIGCTQTSHSLEQKHWVPLCTVIHCWSPTTPALSDKFLTSLSLRNSRSLIYNEIGFKAMYVSDKRCHCVVFVCSVSAICCLCVVFVCTLVLCAFCVFFYCYVSVVHQENRPELINTYGTWIEWRENCGSKLWTFAAQCRNVLLPVQVFPFPVNPALQVQR